jgi:hypothetical protein
MDAKITKTRLGHMLSYDWIKIIALAVAAIVVWSLVFTMTATRITAAQQFTVMNYRGTSLTNKFSEHYYSGLQKNSRIFSHEVIELTVVDSTTGGDDMVDTLLDTRLQTDEGDVIFAADIDNPKKKYKEEGSDEVKYLSYLETFLYGYYRFAMPIDGENGYLAQMENYVNKYYGGDYKTGTIDAAKIEKDFRARIKKNGDKRYKTDKEIKKGIKDDIKRVEMYKNGLVDFLSYLDQGYIELTTTKLEFTNGKQNVTFEAAYSVNLCPTGEGHTDSATNKPYMDKLKEVVYYLDKRPDEKDPEKTVKVASAENMNLVFLRTPKMNGNYIFESVLYVNSLVKTYCSALNGSSSNP